MRLRNRALGARLLSVPATALTWLHQVTAGYRFLCDRLRKSLPGSELFVEEALLLLPEEQPA